MTHPAMENRLRWFGAWNNPHWAIGYKARREAYASGRGGRYQVERTHKLIFVVRYQRPGVDFYDDLGTAVTQEEAIALAQAENDQTPHVSNTEEAKNEGGVWGAWISIPTDPR